MHSIESRNLDSTLTARTNRFKAALKGLVGEFPDDPAAVPCYLSISKINSFLMKSVEIVLLIVLCYMVLGTRSW